MIPQAITSKDPTGDLWSHIKSMLHAINRVEAGKLSRLDRSRLSDLEAFVRQELTSSNTANELNAAALMKARPDHYTYALDIDLQKQLHDLPSYESWLKSKTHSQKEARLQKSLNEWLDSLPPLGSFEAVSVPPIPNEFNILRDLLANLLDHTEAALLM